MEATDQKTREQVREEVVEGVAILVAILEESIVANAFLSHMRQRLDANADKGRLGWREGITIFDLLDKLHEEERELVEELAQAPVDTDRVVEEAADVAVVVMMVADLVKHTEGDSL